jgi:hypothetical protein
MSYFNHAFRKTFVGTNGFNTTKTGRLGTPGNTLAGGEFGFVNPKTWNLIDPAENPGCCNLILAGGSIYQNDKIGPFHGGYQESNKSKEINPKYVSKFYRVDPCTPQSNVIHIGNTAYTDDVALLLDFSAAPGSNLVDDIYNDVELCPAGSAPGGQTIFANITVVGGEVTFVEITNGGSGYTTGDTVTPCTNLPGNGGLVAQPEFEVTAGVGANCCKEFYCGETYTLRVDVKGSPALRLLNHNSYIIASAYGGCCEPGSIAPTLIDSTLIFKQWAEAITRYPVISPFMQIILVDENAVPWYAPGTDPVFLANQGVDTWDHYVSEGHTEGGCAGLVLNGAYVDTKFQNCTFQISDFYELEPVRLYASEVDLNGDPCAFDGVCVITECQGRQAMGLGESVARDVILSEQYRQNFFHSDFRIREITQGYSVFDYINRNTLYTRYFLQHNVPRFNNPSSTFDNDQYLLEVITCGRIIDFEEFVDNWLGDCSQCTGLEVEGCVTDCEPVYRFPQITINFDPNVPATCIAFVPVPVPPVANA